MEDAIKVAPPLIEGNLYQVWEPGLDQWNQDMKYMGYNSLRLEHYFRAMSDPEIWMVVGGDAVMDEVRIQVD